RCRGGPPGRRAPRAPDAVAHLPLFGIAVNSRMIIYAAMGVCVLAAIGLDACVEAGFSRPDSGAGRLKPAATLAWLYLGTAAAIAIVIALTATTLTPEFLRVNAAREIVPLLLASALLRGIRAPRFAAAALVALLIIQRIAEAGTPVAPVDCSAFL